MKFFLCSMLLLGAAGILAGCSAGVSYSPSPTVYGPDYYGYGPYEYYDFYPNYGYWDFRGDWDHRRDFGRDADDRGHERTFQSSHERGERGRR